MNPIHRPSGPASRVAGAVAAALAAAAPVAALAGPAVLLRPGDASAEYPPALAAAFEFPPAGSLVAESVRPFVVRLEAALPPFLGGEVVTTPPRFLSPDGPAALEQPGTFTSRVYRDADGTLTFAYEVALSAPLPPADAGLPLLGVGSIFARGFDGLPVLASGDLGPTPRFQRTDGPDDEFGDPPSVSIVAASGGLPDEPLLRGRFVLDTEATAFDSGGVVTGGFDSYDQAGVFYTTAPSDGSGPVTSVGPEVDNFESIEFAGTFRPADGPAVVPLPAGAWAGLATLGGLGVVGAARRRRAAVA